MTVRTTTTSRSRKLPADLPARVAVAVPAAAVLVLLIDRGGLVFAAALALLGILAQWELARLARVPRAAALPGCSAVGLAPLLAFERGGDGLIALYPLALVAALPIAAALTPAPHRRAALGATALGVGWLGVCLAHGVLLRELPNGDGLLVAVLIATFIGDTAAQLVGTAFGRTRLAPAISPNKTLEGLLAGVAGGTVACWLFATAGPDWLSGADALVLGLACALAAPAGDLFESALKRRAGVKDSGRLFGAHGGALDRVDAALAAAVAGYYVAQALV